MRSCEGYCCEGFTQLKRNGQVLIRMVIPIAELREQQSKIETKASEEESMRVRTLSAALVFFVLIGFLVGCASVDVTKTGKGFYNPTDPNEVEILLNRSEKPYEELGTVVADHFSTSDTAKMYNAIRAKAAPLGANAVVLTGQGTFKCGLLHRMWAQGVAIRYKTEGTQK